MAAGIRERPPAVTRPATTNGTTAGPEAMIAGGLDRREQRLCGSNAELACGRSHSRGGHQQLANPPHVIEMLNIIQHRHQALAVLPR